MLLYDAKAHSGGYEVDADDMRRYEDYVSQFHAKYAEFLNRVHAFLVVSARFNQGVEQRQERYSELIARCGVPLVFLAAKDLGEMVVMLRERSVLRHSVDWRRIFSRHDAAASDLREQMNKLTKDGLMGKR